MRSGWRIGGPPPLTPPQRLGAGGEPRESGGAESSGSGGAAAGAGTGPLSHHPASKLSRGDAWLGDRCGAAGAGGGGERRAAAGLREPLLIAPGARNSAEWSGLDDAGAAGLTHPARAAAPGSRPVEASGPDPAPSRAPLLPKRPECLQVTTVDGQRAKKDRQRERLRLDQRWDFPRRAQNLGTHLY